MDQQNLAFLRQLTRRDIFNIWLEQKGRDNNTKWQHVCNVIIGQLNVEDLNIMVVKDIQKSISRYCGEVTKRWQNSKRHTKRFLEKNFKWLNQAYRLPKSFTEINDLLVLPDSIFCRLCLKVIYKEYTSLCDSAYSEELLQNTKEIEDIKLMLRTCMPTLDLTLSVNPVICEQCLPQLRTSYEFVFQCLANQNRIQRYKEIHAETKAEVNLSDVVQTSRKRNQSPNLINIVLPAKHVKYLNESLNYHGEAPSQQNETVFNSDLLKTEVSIKEEPTEIQCLSEIKTECGSDLEKQYSVDSSAIKCEVNVLDNYEICTTRCLGLFSETNGDQGSENRDLAAVLGTTQPKYVHLIHTGQTS